MSPAKSAAKTDIARARTVVAAATFDRAVLALERAWNLLRRARDLAETISEQVHADASDGHYLPMRFCAACLCSLPPAHMSPSWAPQVSIGRTYLDVCEACSASTLTVRMPDKRTDFTPVVPERADVVPPEQAPDPTLL